MKAMLVHQIDRRGVLCSFVFLFSFGSILRAGLALRVGTFCFCTCGGGRQRMEKAESLGIRIQSIKTVCLEGSSFEKVQRRDWDKTPAVYKSNFGGGKSGF